MTCEVRPNSAEGTTASADMTTPSSVGAPRRAYQKPELIAYGRVEDMTRAGKSSGKEASGKPRSA